MLKFAKHAGERSTSSLVSCNVVTSSELIKTLHHPNENKRLAQNQLEEKVSVHCHTDSNSNHSNDKMMTRINPPGHIRCASFDQRYHFNTKQALDITFPFYKPDVDCHSEISSLSTSTDDWSQNTCVVAKEKGLFTTTKRRRRKSLSSLSSLKKQSAKKVQRTISNEDHTMVTLSPLDINESYASPRFPQKYVKNNVLGNKESDNQEHFDKENLTISKDRAKTIPLIKEKTLDYSTKRSRSWKARFNSIFSKSNHQQPIEISTTEYKTTINDIQEPCLFALTDSLIVKILSYLETDDLCNVAKTCKRMNRLHLSPILWNTVSIRKPYENFNEIFHTIFNKLNHNGNNDLNSLQVQSIRLENSDITDSGLKEISVKCPSLDSLRLKNNSCVTDIGISYLLENCPNIFKLKFSSCRNISFENLHGRNSHSVRSLVDLKSFYCSNCPANGKALSDLLRKANNLEVFTLSNCFSFTNDDLVNIIKFTPKLKYMSLKDCPKVSDESIVYTFQNCTNLQSITLRNCDITDKCFRLFNSYLSNSLLAVDFEGCRLVTDFGLKSLVAICPNITSLNLSGCLLVTDETLYNVTFLKNLKILKLRGCDKIRDGGIRHMAAKLKKLRHLDIRLCDVSKETCSYVTRKCIDCEVFVDKVVYC